MTIFRSLERQHVLPLLWDSIKLLGNAALLLQCYASLSALVLLLPAVYYTLGETAAHYTLLSLTTPVLYIMYYSNTFNFSNIALHKDAGNVVMRRERNMVYITCTVLFALGATVATIGYMLQDTVGDPPDVIKSSAQTISWLATALLVTVVPAIIAGNIINALRGQVLHERNFTIGVTEILSVLMRHKLLTAMTVIAPSALIISESVVAILFVWPFVSFVFARCWFFIASTKGGLPERKAVTVHKPVLSC